MIYKDFFKENNMSQVPIGGQASLSGGSGTYASPDVKQNPGSFPADSSKVNIVPPVDQDIKSKIDPDTYKKDVDAVKTKVTYDDIRQGIEYEQKKQIFKNMMVAKEEVVKNLKGNPRYYRDLGMLGMTPDMMTEVYDKDSPMNDTQKQKLANIIKSMGKQPSGRERVPEYGNFDAIKKLMDEKWAEKQNKRNYNG